MQSENQLTASGSVSIIIPAYNEEQGIGPVLEYLAKIMANSGLAYEIIVVEDGSKDKTSAVLEKHQYIKLIRHKTNKGYGASLKTGIQHARYDYVCITDADGTYPNERIPELMKAAIEKNADMIVGARAGKKAAIPLIRKPAKWVLNKLANYLTNQKIPDLNSGLRIMKKTVVERFINVLPNGFSFTTTITLAMLTRGFNVVYIPIDYHLRKGKSKIRPIHDTLNFLQLIIRTVLYFDPLKIFIPVSLFFFAMSAGMLAYRIFVERSFGATSVILFICGVQLLALGMIADLIDKRMQ